MTVEPAPPPDAAPRAAPLRVLPTAAMLACIFAAATLMLLEFQRRGGAQHYQGEILLFAIAVMVISSLIALGAALANIARRRHIGRSLAWAALAAGPLAFWAAVGWHGHKNWSVRHVPRDPMMDLVKGLGASLMEAQAAWFYPRRVERSRFVMFHHNMPDPDGEADRMEAYLNELEEIVGRPPRERIHWVRGQLLGRGDLSLYGLALGSDESPIVTTSGAPHVRLSNLDRHEVAHAYLWGLLPPDADVPFVLFEGWAEAAARGWINPNSGVEPERIQGEFRSLRADPAMPRLAELLGPSWYHEDRGPVYAYGPHLVLYLVMRDGFDKFRDLCARIRPDTVEATFQDIYGATPAMIEQGLIRESLAPLETAPD